MSITKTILIFVLTGALVGAVVASLVAPGMYTWYATPGAGVSSELLNRASVIHDATQSLLRAQAIGTAVGAAVFLVFGALWARGSASRRKRRKLDHPEPAPPTPTPTPTALG